MRISNYSANQLLPIKKASVVYTALPINFDLLWRVIPYLLQFLLFFLSLFSGMNNGYNPYITIYFLFSFYCYIYFLFTASNKNWKSRWAERMWPAGACSASWLLWMIIKFEEKADSKHFSALFIMNHFGCASKVFGPCVAKFSENAFQEMRDKRRWKTNLYLL